jgi:hypothetical protein
MRRVFLARVTSAQLPLVRPNRTDVIEQRCGAVVGLGSTMGYLLTAAPQGETSDPMIRARSRLVMHIIYYACTFASVQYCTVLETF